MKEKKKFERYEELKDEKAERRDEKKMKKMPVHSSGLYEIWKMKTEKVNKNPSMRLMVKEKNDNHKT